MRGQTLIELLLAIGLTAIILPAILTGLVASRSGKVQQNLRLDAVALLKEAQEAVRNVREKDWNTFAVNGTFHPEIAVDNSWSLIANPETINGFTRQVVISDVYRDATSGAIVLTPGILDPSTKRVVTTISWSSPTPSSITTTSYIARRDNITYMETTEAQFNAGTKSNVTVTNTAGGEIQLANNTKGQWCQPQISGSTVNLDNLPNAVWATEGHIYVAAGQTTNASQVSFQHVLANNTDPPTFTPHGKFLGYKTSDVFGEPNYAYIATTHNTKEIVIIDLNNFSDPINKIYQEIGYFNTTTNSGGSVSTDANAIFVHDDKGYVAAGQYLYVFDLASKSGSRPRIGTRISFANSGDTAGEIYVRTISSNTYAFIAIEGSTPEELKIANVTNPSSNWRIVGKINIEPNNCSTLESGKAVFVNPDGDRAYISSVNDAAFKEFFVIDTSNKSSPSLVGGFATNPPCTNGGGYEAGGLNPEQSVVVSLAENKAILVGTDATADAINGEEYQVLDLSNEGSPSRCGGLQFDQGIFGIAAVKETDGDAYAYIITGDGNAELKVVQGGPDGAFVESGTYESSTLDAGYSTAFNRITATTTTPANTNIQFQTAIADAISNSCNTVTFQFVGPDGMLNTYYPATGSALFLNDNGSEYENPGRCFRYKAFLSTTDYNTTPVLQDTTVNYSP